MNNKPNFEGAKTLLSLIANNDFAKLEINDPTKAFLYLYDCLCGPFSQGTVIIVMAVYRLMCERPDKYSEYINYINQSMREATESPNGYENT